MQTVTLPAMAPVAQHKASSNDSNPFDFEAPHDQPSKSVGPVQPRNPKKVQKSSKYAAVKTVKAGIDAGSRTIGTFYVDEEGNSQFGFYDHSCVGVIVSTEITKDNDGNLLESKQVKKPVAFGAEAIGMEGRVQGVEIVWPVEDGMSRGQLDLVSALIQNALKSIPGCEEGFAAEHIDLELIFGIPNDLQKTSDYIEDLQRVSLNDFKAVKGDFVPQPKLSFLGSGFPFLDEQGKPLGNVCCDGGGSTCGATVLSGLKEIPECAINIETGSGDIDARIADWVDMTYGLPIDLNYAAELKVRMSNPKYAEIKVDLPQLPEEEKMAKENEDELLMVEWIVKNKLQRVYISIRELDSITYEFRWKYVMALWTALTRIPENLNKVAVDAATTGAIITGDGMLVRGFKKVYEEDAKLGKCTIVGSKEYVETATRLGFDNWNEGSVPTPGQCVIIGMARAAQDPEILKEVSVHSFALPRERKEASWLSRQLSKLTDK